MNINIKEIDASYMIIIDTRESFEYQMGHITNSINIPQDLLELVPERYLSKNKRYCLYCEKGIKSSKISNELNQKGYKTYSINGGYEEYKKIYKSN